jgi:PAS domain S-box-containing protein
MGEGSVSRAQPFSATSPKGDEEQQRVQRLHALRILHTSPTGGFDALARLAAAVAGTPAGMINLVDADRVWAKAAVGMPPGCKLPRAGSLCDAVVAQGAVLCVDDAQADARFAAHPAVAGGVRGYAGAPIRLRDGLVVGTVCAIDTGPRRFSAEAVAGLQDVARAAAEMLESWELTEQARLERARLDAERARLANIIEGTRAGTWEWNVQTGEVRFNDRWAGMLGWRLRELEPLSFETWRALVHPEDVAGAEQALCRHFDDPALDYDFEGRMRHRDGRWIWVNYRGRVATWTTDGRPQ